LGEFRQAISITEEGLQVAATLQHPGTLLIAHLSRGEPLLHQGQFHDAVPHLERAMALYTLELGAWYPMTASTLGSAYAMTGRLAEALPLLEEAVERAKRVDRRRETQWLTYLSEVYLRVGRQDDAYAVTERLLALGRERGEQGTEARVDTSSARSLCKVSPYMLRKRKPTTSRLWPWPKNSACVRSWPTATTGWAVYTARSASGSRPALP
ncbi:MAG: tetratricopeptide repeat protein, partial [Candidatus Tectomicrobia bacterium]|nr:tetratricopeptide repeat protein [Candidatus Tectomicrobia bacterium]